MSSAIVLQQPDTVTASVIAEILANHWECVSEHAYIHLSQYNETNNFAESLVSKYKKMEQREYWLNLYERCLRGVPEQFMVNMTTILADVVYFEHLMLGCIDDIKKKAIQVSAYVTQPTHLYLSGMVACTPWHYCHRWQSSSPIACYNREHTIFNQKHSSRRLHGLRTNYIEDWPVEEWPTQLPIFLGEVLHLKNLETFCPPILEMIQLNVPVVGDPYLVDCLFYSRKHHQTVIVRLSLKPLRLLNLAMLTDFFENRTDFKKLPKSGLYEPSDFEEEVQVTEEDLW
jgi:hypothetical protein